MHACSLKGSTWATIVLVLKDYLVCRGTYLERRKMSSSEEYEKHQGSPKTQQTPEKYRSRNRPPFQNQDIRNFSDGNEQAPAQSLTSYSRSQKTRQFDTSSDDEVSDTQEIHTPTKYSSKANHHEIFKSKNYTRKRRRVEGRSQRPTTNNLEDQDIYECVQHDNSSMHEDQSNETAPDNQDHNCCSCDEFPIDNDVAIKQGNNYNESTDGDESNSESNSESCSTGLSTSDGSIESEQDDQKVDVPNEPLYDDSSISTGAACLLILKFCIKYKLSRKAQNDLLHLIKILCPNGAAQKIPKSYGKLIAKTIPTLEKVEKQMVCSTCNDLLKSGICVNGHQQQSTIQDSPYFHTIGLEPQLKMLLEGNEFSNYVVL